MQRRVLVCGWPRVQVCGCACVSADLYECAQMGVCMRVWICTCTHVCRCACGCACVVLLVVYVWACAHALSALRWPSPGRLSSPLLWPWERGEGDPVLGSRSLRFTLEIGPPGLRLGRSSGLPGALWLPVCWHPPSRHLWWGACWELMGQALPGNQDGTPVPREPGLVLTCVSSQAPALQQYRTSAGSPANQSPTSPVSNQGFSPGSSPQVRDSASPRLPRTPASPVSPRASPSSASLLTIPSRPLHGPELCTHQAAPGGPGTGTTWAVGRRTCRLRPHRPFLRATTLCLHGLYQAC